jgi:L-tyrosine isonitrile synthase
MKTAITGFEKVTENIMLILRARCRTSSSKRTCNHLDVTNCFDLQKSKIKKLVELGLPITFILPAFPAKSPNIEKTGGVLPDLGEYIALNQLHEMCKKINIMYPPGAHIIICSDGRVFNDLVMVSDINVNAYSQSIKKIIEENNLNHLSTFSLDEVYCDLSFENMRNEIVKHFGENLNVIKNKVKEQESVKLLFNGIHRFIYEDQLIHFSSISKNKIRQKSKEIAYKVIQRSNAWSKLLEIKFPDFVRLSIHPQSCGSEKFGIILVESKDVWATPWHRVVLKNKNSYQLIKRKEAELLGAQPVFMSNQFSHYTK